MCCCYSICVCNFSISIQNEPFAIVPRKKTLNHFFLVDNFAFPLTEDSGEMGERKKYTNNINTVSHLHENTPRVHYFILIIWVLPFPYLIFTDCNTLAMFTWSRLSLQSILIWGVWPPIWSHFYRFALFLGFKIHTWTGQCTYFLVFSFFSRALACCSLMMVAFTCGGFMCTFNLPPTRRRTVAANLVWVFSTWGGCFSMMKVLWRHKGRQTEWRN